MGARDESAVSTGERGVPGASLSHPNRRVRVDRAATLQQRRQGNASGAGGSSGRNPVAAHEFLGRNDGAAHRRGGEDRRSDSADHEERRISVFKIKGAVEKKQVQRLKQRKKSRNAKKVASVLSQLAGTAEANNDLMPAVMDAVRAQSTVGEICEVFRRVYGEYREAVIL